MAKKKSTCLTLSQLAEKWQFFRQLLDFLLTYSQIMNFWQLFDFISSQKMHIIVFLNKAPTFFSYITKTILWQIIFNIKISFFPIGNSLHLLLNNCRFYESDFFSQCQRVESQKLQYNPNKFYFVLFILSSIHVFEIIIIKKFCLLVLLLLFKKLILSA